MSALLVYKTVIDVCQNAMIRNCFLQPAYCSLMNGYGKQTLCKHNMQDCLSGMLENSKEG